MLPFAFTEDTPVDFVSRSTALWSTRASLSCG
jgi:hypothetical protein